jgi:hypothetical protein
MKRNWKSPKFDALAYRKLTEVNWIAEYRLMYLKQLKLVTRAARPSLHMNWLEPGCREEGNAYSLDDFENAADIEYARCEGGCYGSLGL